MDWSLFGCARPGHVTYAPDEPELRDRLMTPAARRDGLAVPALRRVRDRRPARPRTGRGGAAAPPRQGTAQRADPARVWPVCEMDVRDRSGYREDRPGGAAPHGYLDPASKGGTARRR